MLRRANKNKFCGGKFKFDNMAVRRFAFFLLTLSIMLREVANEMVAAGIVPPICGILSHKNCWHAHHRLLKLLAIIPFPPKGTCNGDGCGTGPPRSRSALPLLNVLASRMFDWETSTTPAPVRRRAFSPLHHTCTYTSTQARLQSTPPHLHLHQYAGAPLVHPTTPAPAPVRSVGAPLVHSTTPAPAPVRRRAFA